MYLFDNNSIDEICEYIINFNNDSNIGLVIIDQLQNLVNYFDTDFSFQLEQAMQKIKNTAKNLNVPIIVVSDLNEDIEYREDDTPLISDINVGYSDIDGSFKKIVKYSDKVLLTYRDIYRLSYNKPTQKEGETSEHFIYRLYKWTEDCKKAQNTYNIIIAKNNFGKLEIINVHSNYIID